MTRFTTHMTAAIVFAVLAAPLAAQTDTTFTYQGILGESGQPANGSFDIEFSLWDALAQGRKVLPSVILNGVSVSDGLFAVELDFGAAAFDNKDRWLEIGVSGNTLTPRQPITRSPYSIQTRGIFVDANNNVGIGTALPAALLHVEGPILSGGPNGGDLTARNPSNETAGVGLGWDNDVPRIRIGGEGAGVSSGFDIQTVGNRSLLRILNDGNVGIGTTNPLYLLHVIRGGGYAIRSETGESGYGVYGSAGAGSYANAGVRGDSESTNGSGVEGHALATSGATSGVYGSSLSSSGSGVYGNASSNSGINYGVYGKSNSAAGFDFFAGGAGANYGATSSRRWKTDIIPIGEPLEKLARLRGVYYTWDEEHGGQHDLGMIAEEVGAVLPEIVQYEENGIDAIGMDYSKMTPLLVEAVKALRAEKDNEIKALRVENKSLQLRLESIEASLAALHTELTQRESQR